MNTMEFDSWVRLIYFLVASFCFITAATSENTQLASGETQSLLRLRDVLNVNPQVWPNWTRPCDLRGITCRRGHVTELKLSGLKIENVSVVVLDVVSEFPQLRHLGAAGVAFPGGTFPAQLQRLGELEFLDLKNTTLRGRIPGWLGVLSKLRTLRLSENLLSGDLPGELQWLEVLTSLDLSHNDLSGEFPAVIFGFSRLSSLNLLGNHFHGVIPAAVGRLKGMRRFSVGINLFSGEIPAELWSLTNITYLDLARNNFSGGLSSDVGRLQRLEFLNVERNNFSGPIPGELSNCIMLRVLKLDHNSFAGKIPSSVGKLSGLQTLFFSFNALSGGLPRELTELQSLKILNVAFNQLFGQLPVGMDGMKSLMLLDVTGNFFNGSVPEKLLPIARFARNCFYQVPRQHFEKSCTVFYRRTNVQANVILPFNKSNNDNGGADIYDIPMSGVIEKKRKKSNLTAIVGGAIGGIALIILIGIAVVFIQRSERRKKRKTQVETVSECEGIHEIGLRRNLGESFSYVQLVEATKKFDTSCLIKVGQSGDFFRGVLKSGGEIVVKRIDLNRVNKDLYVKELEVFGKASHTRLVTLLGHCLEMTEEKFLVYKYMENGDLESLMRNKMVQKGMDFIVHQPLDWIARLKIAIGIAEGLVYLHHECSPPIIHRDIKLSSILLDEKFEVRLGSLSSAGNPDGDPQPGLVARLLAISHSWDHGESGSSVATIASDIYCFGKLLLELISGKTNIIEWTDTHGEHSWMDFALSMIDIHDKDPLPHIVDPHLIVDEDLLEEVWAVAVIAKACLNPRPSKRPSMRHVIKALENPRKVVRVDILNENVATRTSSYSSWNEAFGSCRSSNGSQQVIIPGTLREEHLSSGNYRGRSRSRSRRIHTKVSSSDIDYTQEGGCQSTIACPK